MPATREVAYYHACLCADCGLASFLLDNIQKFIPRGQRGRNVKESSQISTLSCILYISTVQWNFIFIRKTDKLFILLYLCSYCFHFKMKIHDSDDVFYVFTSFALLRLCSIPVQNVSWTSLCAARLDLSSCSRIPTV